MSGLPSTLARDERVYLNRVRIFFGHANGNMASILLGAVLVAIILFNGGVAPAIIAAWAVLLAAACSGVVLFERRVARAGIDADNSRRLARIRIGFGAGIALLYGFTVYLLPLPVSPTHYSFLFIILSTVATVGALGYAVMPTYHVVLAMASLWPLTAHFAYQYLSRHDNFALLLIAVSVLWQLIVLAKSRQVSVTAIDAIVLNERLQDEIAEHQRTREVIRQMALHDELTGLANRRAYEETLTRTLSHAQRTHASVGLITFDLDDFKAVNLERGRAIGDALLRAVAVRLHGAVRAADFCARTGGNEFAVIAGSVRDDTDVGVVADKLRGVFAEPFAVGDLSLALGASVGWAAYPEDGASPAQILAAAEKRMTIEKRASHAGSTAGSQEPALTNLTGLA